MGAETKTHFVVDKSKCVKCGKCINTCSGMVIEFLRSPWRMIKSIKYWRQAVTAP